MTMTTYHSDKQTFSPRSYYCGKVVAVCADVCGVTADDILHPTNRKADHRKAAYVAAWIIFNSFPAVSMQSLAKYFGKSRTQAYHMVDSVNDWLKVSPDYRALVHTIGQAVGGRESVRMLRRMADVGQIKKGSGNAAR